MKTVKLTNPLIIEEAVSALKQGGSVVYPTDTVYGLGVNPFDDFAVRRLFRIKKRSATKPVPLMVRNIAMAKKLAYVNPKTEKILRSIWPGAVSVILKRRDIIPNWITLGKDTVSLRIPDNEFCKLLLKEFNGPVSSTSANISGENPMSDPAEIRKRFLKEIFRPDLIIDAGILEAKQPSTILDLSQAEPRVLRVGPVKPDVLSSILGIGKTKKQR